MFSLLARTQQERKVALETVGFLAGVLFGWLVANTIAGMLPVGKDREWE